MNDDYQMMAVNAISHEAFCAGQAWQQAAAAHERPCVLWKPRLFIDGNQWCALFGENIQEGVVGFGDSPDEAMWAFDAAWRKKLSPLPGAQPAPSVPDGWKEGVEAAARLIDQKAERYANQFGIDDVGGLSFGQGPHAEIKMDHYTSMIELADEVRAMLAARARMSVPEGWKLVPIEPTPTMITAALESSHVLNVHRVLACYDAMIDAAPEAKS